MSVYVTAVHLTPTNADDHRHISDVKWQNPNSRESGQATREGMVKFIRDGGEAKVADRAGDVDVLVVEADPPYIRTYADGRPTDNLLSLPRF